MKQPFYFGMSVDDVALRNWCKPENFEHLIDFFQTENIPATFFVVPIDEESDKPFFTLSDRYLPLIRAAHAAGFDLGQHGLRHNRFELGIPPAMVLDLPHEVDNKRYAEKNAVARLQQGRKILEDAFGFAVTGFRAPALQESPGMFAALAAEKYPYDSSCVLQETGWDYLLDKLDVPPREITRVWASGTTLKKSFWVATNHFSVKPHGFFSASSTDVQRMGKCPSGTRICPVFSPVWTFSAKSLPCGSFLKRNPLRASMRSCERPSSVT